MDRKAQTVVVIELIGLGLSFLIPWVGVPLMVIGLAVVFWPKSWPFGNILAPPQITQPPGEQSRSTELAFVQYELAAGGFRIIQSANVASITDNGSRSLTVKFEHKVPNSYTIDIRSDHSLHWRATERNEHYFRIEFEGEEPTLARIGVVGLTVEAVQRGVSALAAKAAAADTYLELARQSGETAETLSKILADYMGVRRSSEKEDISQSQLRELERSILDLHKRMDRLQTRPAPANFGGELLIEELGQNLFRVWLKVPMAKVPVLTFTDLPAGVTGRVLSANNTSFIVEFTPKSVQVHTFGFFANARLN